MKHVGILFATSVRRWTEKCIIDDRERDSNCHLTELK